MSGDTLAAAAERLVGTPFRLHGRDPATGLDCIGVLCAAMSEIGRPVVLPNGYRLRSNRIDGLAGLARACGFTHADTPTLPGDVMMVRCAPCQFHLLIAVAEECFVHAHARLKRVVLGNGEFDWPVIGHWRLDDASQG